MKPMGVSSLFDFEKLVFIIRIDQLHRGVGGLGKMGLRDFDGTMPLYMAAYLNQLCRICDLLASIFVR